MPLKSLQWFPTTYRINSNSGEGQSHSSFIPYSLLPCILLHISYSGQRAQNTVKPFHSFVPLLMFPLFPQFIYAQIRSTYFLFALLDLFSIHLLCVGRLICMDCINALSCLLASDWLWLIGGQKNQIRVFYYLSSLLAMAKDWLHLSSVGALH